MKKIMLFVMETCPYCREALKFMETLFAENAAYKRIEIEIVDERKNPVLANQYDYYYVPSFYVAGMKQHEGAATLEKVRRVFDEAMK